MKALFVLTLLVTSLSAQTSSTGPTEAKLCDCGLSANLLSRAVLHEIWSHDEEENSPAFASGFIRISVCSGWDDPDFFVDVRLNTREPPTVISYSMPKGTQNFGVLVKQALEKAPCATVSSLAKSLPIEKRTFPANKQMEDSIKKFFDLKLSPKRLNSVRLDATEYQVEFLGDYTIEFRSDDFLAPMTQWAESFVSLVRAASQK